MLLLRINFVVMDYANVATFDGSITLAALAHKFFTRNFDISKKCPQNIIVIISYGVFVPCQIKKKIHHQTHGNWISFLHHEEYRNLKPCRV